VSSLNKRQALTLMELIVVLVILVALAGIVVPLLPNMIGRTHTASAATSITEANRIIQTYEQLYQSYPNDLDNLAGTGGPVDYLPAVPAQFTVAALKDYEAAALVNSGITRVWGMYDTKVNLLAAGGTPTFNPYSSTTAQAVATGLNVAYLTETAVESLSGIVRDDPALTGDVYVVFGFGKRTTAIGKVVSDAPLHFGENAASNANSVYCRFGIVFRVARGNGTATPTKLDRAVFVGVVDFGGDGISGSDAHLGEYYKTTGNN